MNGLMKQASFWIVMLILVVLALSQFSQDKKPEKELLKADFVPQIEAGNVESPVIWVDADGDNVEVTVKLKEAVEGKKTFTFLTKEFTEEWEVMLAAQGISHKGEKRNTFLPMFLMQVVPLILLVGLIYFFFFRQMQGGNNKAMSFGKSRAKMANQGDKTATFEDVAGVDEAKEELQEVIEFLKDPKKFTRLGGKIPRGVLLLGPPGSGKTLLARAVAGEANVPFFSISGSDFVEMFVGVGASRVRDLFQQGHRHAPCIIFIDEIDAVGRQRGAGLGGGHDEREQTLNQLLVEMDGFNTNDGVILMAATNRPDVLDKALLRPGRFDRQIMVANPDIVGRKAILEIHIRNQKVPVADDVETKVIARGTPGFSGADLANLVNEAALLAARRSQDDVKVPDFEDAKDRVLMGPARRSLVMSDKDKRATAYHEAGHTLVARLQPNADPIHKVTIIPRGQALGVTSSLPEEDRHSITRDYCHASLRLLMGGRAAEEIIFSQFNSGASSDLKRATQLAHSMVCEWGMSDLGPITFGSNDEVFLGRDFSRSRDFSEETASAVDREVHRLIEESYRDTKEMLTEHTAILEAIAETLYERETLEAEEIDEIIRANGGEDLVPPPKPKKTPTEEPPSDDGTPERVEDNEEPEEELPDTPPDGIVPDTA
jgi:cell division protease FtsH